jgi:selenocysteine lyase/cysteine desulfurase
MNIFQNIKKIKSYFPVTEHYIFFNNAGESPMITLCRDAVDEFYELASRAPQKKPDVRLAVKVKLTDILGGSTNEYALVSSTGVGIGMVASGMQWKAGDNIVLPEQEHRNNLFPWLYLQKKGVEIRFVPVSDNGYLKLSDFEALIDNHTKLVAVAAVRYNSGFRINLKKLSIITHQHQAILLVDGVQAAGVVPLNVDEMGIDILCSAGFKWLLGLSGTGFLYIKKESQHLVEPVMPGSYAASYDDNTLVFHQDARKYETGAIAYSQFHGWLEGLELIKTIGINNIYDRILFLTDLLIEGLKSRNFQINTPIDNRDERSAILFCSFGDETRNEMISEALAEDGIIITIKEGKCRISPSFYNTSEEIEKFFASLDYIIENS